MYDYTVISKNEDGDHFAERTFKIGQILTELFKILCAKKVLRNFFFFANIFNIP